LTSNEAVLTLNENPQSATRSFGSFMEFPYAKPQTSLRSKDLSEPMSALLPAESALVSPVNTLSALSTIRYFHNSTGRPARNAPSAVLRMKIVGANPQPEVAGGVELPGKVNYFIGNDPKKWRTNISTYAKVKYQGVYPGIDLVYYGNQQQLEYDFV